MMAVGETTDISSQIGDVKMTDDKTAKAQPTLAELESKVQRLTNQVSEDTKTAESAEKTFASAIKNGDVDGALKMADVRTAAKATLAKSESQLKTATNAIASAKHAASADKIAAIHDQMRDNGAVNGFMAALEPFGVTQIRVERSAETGKLLINSTGPSAPKRSGGGGGGNGRGQPLTVDGKAFDSANAALMHHYPDFTGKMGRTAIVARLINAGHEVS